MDMARELGRDGYSFKIKLKWVILYNDWGTGRLIDLVTWRLINETKNKTKDEGVIIWRHLAYMQHQTTRGPTTRLLLTCYSSIAAAT